VRKKERSPLRGHELGKPFFLSPEKEDRSDLRINSISTLGKANPSLGYN